MDDTKHKYVRLKQWFIDRMGKTVYRTITDCNMDCPCHKDYINGVKIDNEMHAIYMFDCQNELHLRYFDTIKERNEYEIDEIT